MVEYLLRNHASLQTVDSFGRTALDHATTDDVKALLQSARSQLGGRSTCWMPCDDVTSLRKYDLQHSQHAQLLAAALRGNNIPTNVRLFVRQGWRGGATVGRRTCDQEVASSIPGQGAAA